MRTYIEWCRLLNKLNSHGFAATTPVQYDYWTKHRAKLRGLLVSKGWKI